MNQQISKEQNPHFAEDAGPMSTVDNSTKAVPHGSGALHAAAPSNTFLAKVVILAILTPVLFNLGSLLMTTSRLVFIFLVPYLCINLLRGKYGPIKAADVFVALFIFWIGISIAKNNPSSLVTFVGMNALAFLGGYLTARACIRNEKDFIDVYKFLAWVIVLLLPLAVYEAITSNFVIPALIEKIPGVFSRTEVDYPRRLGLDRAQVVFDHPIHWGTFASIGFSASLVAFRSIWGRGKRLLFGFLIGVACFVSVSSGPFLALLFQLALIIYWLMFRKFRGLWVFLICGFVFLYILAELLSDRPAFYAIASRMAFNSSTANVRMVLLEYGIAQIGRTPLMGVGYNYWGLPQWMSGSMDNYWLLNAVVYGLPALFFLVAVFATLMGEAARRKFDPDSPVADVRRAWMIAMFGLILTLATVAVWAEMTSIVFFIIGSGAFLGSVDITRRDEEGVAPPDAATSQRAANRFTRFPAHERDRSGATKRFNQDRQRK
ncbi:O-antigen ligase family protein [Phycobacter sp. K97]|uniref:O-antigen ligase family protein n=1 Tax=Phycobacter sedimenti TaxID=3133977 RepID=UPI00311E7BE5